MTKASVASASTQQGTQGDRRDLSAFSLKITEARTNARRWETHGDARRDTASDFLRYPALVEEQRFCDVKIIIDGMRRHEGDAAVQEEGCVVLSMLSENADNQVKGNRGRHRGDTLPLW
jgi:hypothetical protein